ncbi:MAG: DUF1003 domain-containing protein [Nanoarchaeota archaeon]
MENKIHPGIKHTLTLGQKAADKLTSFAGSWGFIITFFVFILIWMAINVMMLINRWDPYPFILLNLILSCLAAIQAPIILMSQNREAQRDRLRSQYDYSVNLKAEREIRDMKKDLEEIKKLIKSNR